MNQVYLIEEWKKLEFDDNIAETELYEISTHGRIKCVRPGRFNGLIIKQSATQGFRYMSVKQKSGKKTARYTHKLVAQTFIEKKSDDQNIVLHLDYDKENNTIMNLMWATQAETTLHQSKNPKFINRPTRYDSAKLTEGMVRVIKKKLFDPKRKTRLRLIAKQFGVSEMQLHRIKTGENWGHVKIDSRKDDSDKDDSK